MARSMLSPLRILLCAAFFFSTHVFAVSAVLGVDLGTEYIKAALVKPGIPLEIVLTKDSRRKEASAVAFKPPQNGAKAGTYPERLYGSDAMALAARFPGDVYPNLKALLGLPTDSPVVKDYASRHPALQLETHKLRDTAAFKSKDAFTAEEDSFLVEELLAMELQSIQKNAEALAGSGTSVRSVVITVPPFYTIEEKRAIELAADLAGLKVLSLISDGLAVGLNYATSRQFPNINDGGKPEHHMVFDMGAGSTKATILKMQSRTVKDVGKFNKTIQEVIVSGSGWDRSLGGDALNALIVDDMVEKFVETSGAKKISAASEGVKAHGRAIAKLSKEAERLRHVLSANQNTQASFEGLYEDVDFRYKITRADFESMCEAHAERVGRAVDSALEMAGLKVSDLDSVILHGGATRTPFVQKELEKIFGGADKLRSNVNSDEAAVFGAGFRAAEISPSFRVKEIRISEGSVYSAGMKWTNEKQKAQHQRLWTSTSYLGAPAKEVTFNNKEDFTVDFYQQVPPAANDVTPGIEERTTKVLSTKNLTATVAMLGEKYSCEPSAVQFKVGLRLASENGEVEVTKAYVECEAEVVEKEGFVDGVKNLFGFGKKDQQPIKDGEASEDAEGSSSASAEPSTTTESSEATSSTSTTSTVAASESAEATGKKTKKMVSIPVQYELKKAGIPQLEKADLTSLKDRLKAFEASDRSRRLREEALNQLEGFTYKVRDLLDSEVFIAASTEEERSTLEKKSSEASEWLYGDGADASREELKKRHKELQDIVILVQKRIEEGSKRPELIQGLKEALNQTNEFVNNIKEKIAEAEAWSSSQAASSTASSESSSTVTAAPSADDFAGLEDEDSTSTTTAKDMDDVLKERGPVPPLYKLEDLKESEDLYQSITEWLKEKEAEQHKLGPTDDPVLTVKELTEKREKLDKAGMDLAMKGVKNFEGKKKSKGSKSSKTGAAGEEPTLEIKPDEEGQMPSQEEIEEMIKKFQEEAAAKAKEGKTDGAPKHDEL
ncbi:putative heat shock protein 70-like protein [Phaeoacremonium minimum UCRPA7]|uniref:Putative heat shock protein 70-like protein n=1 Tax=Phaeoacremonium minimum (strain UCR-PA7) TaxID=1286976 RepID=R8BR74_PHAM7|nr:putative heat shock protein 70-like protein [Phaeoacremonium minimum UCRPA7]EOO01868.1 putative heat shock protein 70-like protein [Phaeoacremonium minimum UCRPA7]